MRARIFNIFRSRQTDPDTPYIAFDLGPGANLARRAWSHGQRGEQQRRIRRHRLGPGAARGRSGARAEHGPPYPWLVKIGLKPGGKPSARGGDRLAAASAARFAAARGKTRRRFRLRHGLLGVGCGLRPVEHDRCGPRIHGSNPPRQQGGLLPKRIFRGKPPLGRGLSPASRTIFYRAIILGGYEGANIRGRHGGKT